MKKISLIFPNYKKMDLFNAIPYQPSLSLGYLVGILHKNQAEFQLIDAAAENMNIKRVYKKIESFNPDFIGITTNISISYSALHLSRMVKKRFPKIRIIMGGPYATAQDKMLIENKYADIVVLGEGELTLIDILNTKQNYMDEIEDIKGISYNSLEGYKTTGFRNHIVNLDELPFPKWEYFSIKGITRSHRYKQMYPFITSRGCPYPCKNCTKIIHGNKIRFRSIKNMLKELDYLKSIGAKEIAIEDDAFNFDLNRIKKFLIEVIKKKYGFKIQLSNGIRADKVDKEFAELLYAAGVYKVALGVESGSQKVISFLGKGLNLKEVPKSVKILQNAHIKVFGYFIIGLPIEYYQSLLYTIDFAIKSNFDSIVLLTYVVFPGTELWNYVIKNTNYATKLQKNLNYHHSTLQFSTKEINSKVVKKVQLYYIVRVFLNPYRLFKYISCYNFSEFLRQMIRNIVTLIRNTITPKI